jgi:hypothetical protein
MGYLVPLLAFGGLATYGLLIIRDFRGLRSNFAARFGIGSPDWKRAQMSSLIPGWCFPCGGIAVILAISLRLLGAAMH